MKHKTMIWILSAGVFLILAGLAVYGMGVYKFLPVPRPDLAVAGMALIGSILALAGACLLLDSRMKTKEMEIEEKDERNVMIQTAALAYAFICMYAALFLVVFALVFTGYMNVVSCFSIMGVLILGAGAYFFKFWDLQKKM